MEKKIILGLSSLAFLFLCYGKTPAQTGVGDYQSGFDKKGNTITFSNEHADVRLEFCTSSMVRIRTSWDGNFAPDEPYMVVNYQWPALDLQMVEEDRQFIVNTAAFTVKINKSPFLIEIADKDGKVLSTEFQTATGGGLKEGDEVTSRKKLMADEHFFGFGERMDFIDQRGKKVHLNVGRGQGRPHIIGAYNVLEANYSPVPFFMSTRGYGIFLHNSYANEWDMGLSDPDVYSFKAEGGELDYYFIYGPQFGDILNSYTQLTGKSPLLPKFAHGLHVGTYSGGTWGYEHLTSTHYVVRLAQKFRELGIPLDMLHLDSTWRIFGESGGSGATTFEWRPTFKNPELMFDSLYDLNLNMVGVHVRPRFDNGDQLDLLDQAREKGYVYPEDDNPGEFVNFFDQEAVDWWWENGVKRVADIGAMFLKTDEGSAFGRKANESDKIGPTGEEIEKLHNIFPLVYAQAPFEKFQEYNGVRGLNMTREGYAGIQRYPYIFAGDWPSEWQYFEPVIKAGINIGMSGVGYWTHCMGGFEHDADPELYIRWCQFGMFSPVAHLFGMDHPGYKEPWNYGEEALRIFKMYDSLRYRLIPYIYTSAYEMNQTGMPIMRGLVLDYQNDPNVYSIGDQYLFGSSMLVCPVTTKGAQTRTLYLPEGEWYDFWTGKKYQGKQYMNVVTPIERMPIYLKAGSIIPTQEVMNYIGEKPADPITVSIYPGGSSSYNLYDDDGRSLNYQNGEYALTLIETEERGNVIQVTIHPPKGEFEVPERTYRIRTIMENAPASVAVGKKSLKKSESPGNNMGWHYDEESNWLVVTPGVSSKQAINLTITKQ